MTSETRIAYGSRVSRQGRSLPCSPNHARSSVRTPPSVGGDAIGLSDYPEGRIRVATDDGRDLLAEDGGKEVRMHIVSLSLLVSLLVCVLLLVAFWGFTKTPTGRRIEAERRRHELRPH
jgi:ribosomal protein L34